MMLTYFPPMYEGELLYGTFARYSVHFALSGPMDCSRSLFGTPKAASATYDLPKHLDAFAARLGLNGVTGVSLAHTATLLPYYIAWQPDAVRQWAENAMCGHAGGIHTKLGLSKFHVARETRLKFCPECLLIMKAEHEEAYWRRDHQLPSVVVCPDHGCPLLKSPIDLATLGRFTYLPANEISCPDIATPACRISSAAVGERLMQLANASAALLNVERPARELGAQAAEYRLRLLRV